MFGAPIVVILYCFFIAVSPFCPKDSGQTRKISSTLKIFLKFFSQTRKELATLTRNLWIRKKQDVFFLSRGNPIRFRSYNSYMTDTNRATARVKNIVRTIKIQKISLYFLLFPCRVRQNRIVRFPSKDKKNKRS